MAPGASRATSRHRSAAPLQSVKNAESRRRRSTVAAPPRKHDPAPAPPASRPPLARARLTWCARAGAQALQEAGFREVYAHIMKGTAHGIAPDGLQVALAFLRDKCGF